jgi:dTDP-4-amino-4,6-dideoxygalactose transaminase
MLPPGANRKSLMSSLADYGIESTIGTYRLPLTKYQCEKRGFKPGDLVVTDDMFVRRLSLPLYAGLEREQQKIVANTLLDLL